MPKGWRLASIGFGIRKISTCKISQKPQVVPKFPGYVRFVQTSSPVSVMDKVTYEMFFDEFPIIDSRLNMHGLGNGGLN